MRDDVLIVQNHVQLPIFQISPEDGPLRSHPLLKDAPMDNLSGSSLTTFYPSLAKLINGDMAERTKVRLPLFDMHRYPIIIPYEFNSWRIVLNLVALLMLLPFSQTCGEVTICGKGYECPNRVCSVRSPQLQDPSSLTVHCSPPHLRDSICPPRIFSNMLR